MSAFVRLLVLSDLHLESAPFETPDPDLLDSRAFSLRSIGEPSVVRMSAASDSTSAHPSR